LACSCTPKKPNCPNRSYTDAICQWVSL